MSNYKAKLFAPLFFNAQGARMPNDTGWQTRHEYAVRAPRGAEIPIVTMIAGWAAYADRHAFQFESGIGDDGVLGPPWAVIGSKIRQLLNGDTGRLDCGTLDAFLCDTLEAEGFDPDGL